jgi:hypothetical protein
MTSLPISRAWWEQVKQRADFRCEYCQTSEWLSGVEGEIDHWRSQRARFGPGLAIIHLPRSNPSRDRLRIEQPPIDFTNPADMARHDRMVSLVERMLDLHKRVAAEQVPHAKTMLQRHAEGGSDRQADRRVGG